MSLYARCDGQFGSGIPEQARQLILIETVVLATEFTPNLGVAASRRHGGLGFIGTKRNEHGTDPFA